MKAIFSFVLALFAFAGLLIALSSSFFSCRGMQTGNFRHSSLTMMLA